MNTLQDKFNEHIRKHGKAIEINGVDAIGFFKEIDEKQSTDLKYLFVDKGLSKQGDIINSFNNTFIVINEPISINDVYDKVLVQRCNYNIKFNFLGNVKSFPTILLTKVLDISTNTYISVPVGKIIVELQDNLDTRDIVLTQRLLIMGQAFKVIGIDKSKIGLIILNCDTDMFSSEDDKVNEIANRWTYEIVHTYVLTMNNGETAMVNINDILSISATVTDNGVAMINPAITYLSSDSAIVSVDNSGKIMGIGLGNATVTARMTNNPTILDTISITVQEVPVTNNYSIAITGSATIKTNQTLSYTATFYNNGTVVTDQSGTWSIVYPNPDATNNAYASITTQTGTSAAVKGTSNTSWINKYFILNCTLVSDPSISITKQIQTKAVF